MTSHALTDAQEEAIHHACLDLMDLPHYSDSRHEDSLRILRDLARTLLEPVEKERDAEREHRKINERLLENMSVRCEQREGELAEAREENTRLREQLGQVKKDRKRCPGYTCVHVGGYGGHCNDCCRLLHQQETPKPGRGVQGIAARGEVTAETEPLWKKLAAIGDAIPDAEWDRIAHARVSAAEKELAAARAALEPRPEEKP